jgi:hypothetical protein
LREWDKRRTMKRGKILWGILLGLLVLSACDDKRDSFSGLSNLVEERREVRQAISDKKAREKALERQQPNADAKAAVVLDKEKKKRELSPIILYGRNVEIVDSSNRMALAKGIAYLNKEGLIVKITIIRE